MPASKTIKLVKPSPQAIKKPVKRASTANAHSVAPPSNTRVMLDEINARGEQLTAKISDLLRRLS